MTLSAIQAEQSKKVDQLINDCQLFFAFNDEQFAEGKDKTPLAEGDKFVSIGSGGYLPKSKGKAFLDGMDAIDAWFKGATKDEKIRKQHIAYELENHEAYYTGDIQDTLDALGSSYTEEEVLAVYRS